MLPTSSDMFLMFLVSIAHSFTTWKLSFQKRRFIYWVTRSALFRDLDWLKKAKFIDVVYFQPGLAATAAQRKSQVLAATAVQRKRPDLAVTVRTRLRTHLTRWGILVTKLKRSNGRLIFMKGIPIHGEEILVWERATAYLANRSIYTGL